jgi:acyl carrier protein
MNKPNLFECKMHWEEDEDYIDFRWRPFVGTRNSFDRILGGKRMEGAAMRDKIVEIIANQLGIDRGDVTPEASVVDDLGADSLDVVELIMALEEEFNLEIPDEEAEKIKSVQDIFSHMESAVQAA